MERQEMGNLERVNPREIWADEARDFTPWLRRNIGLLSDAVGIDLEITESEESVGSFKCDLFGKDLSTGREVVIENQLGPTNHEHLGKLLAYAAGKDAGVAVWVSTDLRDEHRDTLNWLNNISGEDRLFFGITVEVLRISGSKPAVNLVVDVQPSDWGKEQRGGTLSRKQKAYENFFTDLLAKVKSTMPGLTSAKKGLPQNWLSLPTGRSGFAYDVFFGRDSQFGVQLRIETGDKDRTKSAFDVLHQERDKIGHETDLQLSWERFDELKKSSIIVLTKGSIEDDDESLADLQQWAVDKLVRFNKAFRGRISRLKSV